MSKTSGVTNTNEMYIDNNSGIVINQLFLWFWLASLKWRLRLPVHSASLIKSTRNYNKNELKIMYLHFWDLSGKNLWFGHFFAILVLKMLVLRFFVADYLSVCYLTWLLWEVVLYNDGNQRFNLVFIAIKIVLSL